MASYDPLDDLLSNYDTSLLNSTKKTLRVLKEAYTLTVPGLVAKSMTDRLAQAAGVRFHLGTPDPELQRLASWLFTIAAEDQPRLLRLTRKLWNRHGREDMRLAGLILANLDPTCMNESPWEELSSMVGKAEPLEALLEVVEEVSRAKVAIPSDSMLERYCTISTLHHHLAMLIINVCSRRDARKDLSLVQFRIVKSRPDGPELLDRIAERMLEHASE